MRRWLALAAISLCALPAGHGSDLDIADRGWTTYDVAHFRFITDLPEDRARALIQRVVQFDKIAASLHEAALPPERAPLKVLVFRNRGDFEQIFAFENFAGFTLPSLHEHTIALGPDEGGRHLSENTLHEYTHYILRQSPLAPLPQWYEEGYASLLASARFDDGTAVIGHPGKLRPPARLHIAQNPITVSSARGRLPMEIGPRHPFSLAAALRPGQPDDWPDSEVYAFYTSAWLLVHYLVLGEPELRTPLADYLRSATAEATPPHEFARLFDRSDRQMQRTLARYARRRSLPTTEVPLPETDMTAAMRVLAPSEALFELGIASATHNSAFAEAAFAHLQSLESEAHRALVGQAILARAAGQHAEAGQLATQALRHAPHDTAARTLLARATADACPEAKRCHDAWRQAAQHFEQALHAEPDRTDALLGLGAVQFRLGELDAALMHLQAAYARAPWSARVNFFLGEAYRLADRAALARKHLNRAERWERNPRWKARARRALALLG
jgi:tetratricopeptide (TPR) repeat protein